MSSYLHILENPFKAQASRLLLFLLSNDIILEHQISIKRGIKHALPSITPVIGQTPEKAFLMRLAGFLLQYGRCLS